MQNDLRHIAYRYKMLHSEMVLETRYQYELVPNEKDTKIAQNKASDRA